MVKSSEVVKINLESYPVSLWQTDMTDCCVELPNVKYHHWFFTFFWLSLVIGDVLWLLGGRNLISQLCRIRWGWSLDMLGYAKCIHMQAWPHGILFIGFIVTIRFKSDVYFSSARKTPSERLNVRDAMAHDFITRCMMLSTCWVCAFCLVVRRCCQQHVWKHIIFSFQHFNSFRGLRVLRRTSCFRTACSKCC